MTTLDAWRFRAIAAPGALCVSYHTKAMSELNLGKIIEPNEVVDRDAIHVAVAPVIAGEKLAPGEHVGLNGEGQATEGVKHIGIVDPFLKTVVKRGERFWLFLYPKTITNLRHHWTHPEFETKSGTNEHEQWIRDCAERIGLSYSLLMETARLSVEDPEYYLNTGSNSVYLEPEFWTHFEALTGLKGSGSPFACAC